MPKVATMYITFITLLLAFIRFPFGTRLQYFNVLDERHRLIGRIYLTLCRLPQHATFCFRNTLLSAFRRVPLRFLPCKHLPNSSAADTAVSFC